jgi:hypothetical protein
MRIGAIVVAVAVAVCFAVLESRDLSGAVLQSLIIIVGITVLGELYQIGVRLQRLETSVFSSETRKVKTHDH